MSKTQKTTRSKAANRRNLHGSTALAFESLEARQLMAADIAPAQTHGNPILVETQHVLDVENQEISGPFEVVDSPIFFQQDQVLESVSSNEIGLLTVSTPSEQLAATGSVPFGFPSAGIPQVGADSYTNNATGEHIRLVVDGPYSASANRSTLLNMSTLYLNDTFRNVSSEHFRTVEGSFATELGGTVSIRDGVATYQPPESPTDVEDRFSYSVQYRGHQLSTSVEVRLLDVAPTAVGDSFRYQPGSQTAISTRSLKSNDINPGEGTRKGLTIIDAELLTQDAGSIELTKSHLYFNSLPEYSGSVAIRYTVQDSEGLSSSAIINGSAEIVPSWLAVTPIGNGANPDYEIVITGEEGGAAKVKVASRDRGSVLRVSYEGKGAYTVRNARSVRQITFHGTTANDHFTNDTDIPSTVYAGAGDDTVYGGSAGEYIDGGAGNDRLFGRGGSDTLRGLSGHDYISGGKGGDRIYGGDGVDVLRGNGGQDRIWGGEHADDIRGGRGNDELHGEAGDDTIQGDRGRDLLFGGNENDELYGGTGQDTLDGGAGTNQLIQGRKKKAGSEPRSIEEPVREAQQMPGWLSLAEGVLTIQGDDQSESFAVQVNVRNGVRVLEAIRGGERVDLGAESAIRRIDFFGGGGNDRFQSQANVPVIAHGQSGDDSLEIYSGVGASLFGGDGNDRLIGGSGDDQMSGGDGDDTLIGHQGNDTLAGNAGSDRLLGGNGDDVLSGGRGGDFLDGAHGNDHLEGGRGADQLFGGHGNDSLKGGGGDDSLSGGDGDDTLSGGKGADRLDGGVGIDVLRGNRGADYLISLDNAFDELFGGKGKDRFNRNGLYFFD